MWRPLRRLRCPWVLKEGSKVSVRRGLLRHGNELSVGPCEPGVCLLHLGEYGESMAGHLCPRGRTALLNIQEEPQWGGGPWKWRMPPTQGHQPRDPIVPRHPYGEGWDSASARFLTLLATEALCVENTTSANICDSYTNSQVNQLLECSRAAHPPPDPLSQVPS